MYLIHFSPIDGPFCEYQLFATEPMTEQVKTLLNKRYGPAQNPKWYLYEVDADCWAILSPTLEIGQSRLLVNWLNYLQSCLEDEEDSWFGDGKDLSKRDYAAFIALYNRGYTVLYNAKSITNVMEELDLTEQRGIK